MAWLLTRGVRPGQMLELSTRLGDVTAELQAEREKLERAARRAEHVRRSHEAGRISAWDIPAALGDDLGDEGRVLQLERQAESLRSQLGQVQEAMAPPERRDTDPLEAATRRAHEAFVSATRAAMAEAEARRPEPRPFAGPGEGTDPEPGQEIRRGGLGDAAGCGHCANLGATPAERERIHAGVL